jgi:3-methyladenine DNA glycosylase AlkC
LDDFDAAMLTLREITIRFTSEFAIRRFLRERPEATFAQLAKWVHHPNDHVRRLVSEGSRPLLPWGGHLTAVIKNPSLTLPLLDQLHADPSEYVRKSVANHLNDFSKSHPDLVLKTLRRWKKARHPDFGRLANRAARTLIKQGHPETLAFFGYDVNHSLSVSHFSITPEQVSLGEAVKFRFVVKNRDSKPQALLFDYAIHHRKKDGRLTAKVFKGRKTIVPPNGTWEVEGQHPLRVITTRAYHPGLHRFEILLNGQSAGILDFELQTSVK